MDGSAALATDTAGLVSQEVADSGTSESLAQESASPARPARIARWRPRAAAAPNDFADTRQAEVDERAEPAAGLKIVADPPADASPDGDEPRATVGEPTEKTLDGDMPRNKKGRRTPRDTGTNPRAKPENASPHSQRSRAASNRAARRSRPAESGPVELRLVGTEPAAPDDTSGAPLAEPDGAEIEMHDPPAMAADEVVPIAEMFESPDPTASIASAPLSGSDGQAHAPANAHEADAAVDGDTSESPQPIAPLQIVEALLFASDSPLTGAKIAQAIGVGDARDVRKHVAELNERYERMGAAFRIHEIAGGYQMMTLPAFNVWLAKLHQARQDTRLSAAAMETLAVVAYKQPVTRAEIEAIRGVAAGDVVNRLRELDLVKIVGRAEDLGRPMLYGTTRRFLEIFGLAGLEALPKVEDVIAPAGPKGAGLVLADDVPQVDGPTDESPPANP